MKSQVEVRHRRRILCVFPRYAPSFGTFHYAYPLMLMEVTRRVSTNVAAPIGLNAPVNQLAHAREFPDPSFTIVVRPNADTLYTALTYDVTKEPLVVSVPDSGGRYYLMPWLDCWTDVFTVPGKRTTGTGAQTFAIAGVAYGGLGANVPDDAVYPTAFVDSDGRPFDSGER